jgi:phosphoribosylanthranilate isomerase
MLRVKICGITQVDDARFACDLGADAIGFIFYEKSPRYIAMENAAAISEQLPDHVARVGVFVNTPRDEMVTYLETVGLNVIQFHGNYPISEIEQFEAGQVIAVVRVGETFRSAELEQFRGRAAAILLDTHKKGRYGGTGAIFDWQAAIDAKVYGRIILAGGLNPDNVRQAVEMVSPYAIDVSSGVEAQPGKKDRTKLQQFFRNLKEYRDDWQINATHRFPIA